MGEERGRAALDFVEVNCQNCNGLQRVAQAALGKSIKCYRCGARLGAGTPQPDAPEVIPSAEAIVEGASAPVRPRSTRPQPDRELVGSQGWYEAGLAVEARQLRQQRLTCQIWSFLLGLPGIGLLAASYAAEPPRKYWLIAFGYLLLWAGIAFGVAYKRYSLQSAFWGLLGLLGLVILALLPDQKLERLQRIEAVLKKDPEAENPG